MNPLIKHFYGAFFVTVIAVFILLIIEPIDKFYSIYLIVVLALFEFSLSFDNAIINAKVLSEMTKYWQKIFMWIGLPFAVFFIRFTFPILIVSIMSHSSLFDTCKLAMYNPKEYQKSLELILPFICTFGGSFLMMVFLKFFLAEKRQLYWITVLENNKVANVICQYPGGHIIIGIIIGVIVINSAKIDNQGSLALAFFLGVIIHECLSILTYFFNKNIVNTTVKNGFIGFLYLEILDASFSLDSVIGAFAISTNIFIIMTGLGIGSMYMRSLTILFVKNQLLVKLCYLEHGAHYAIGFLASIMFIKINIHISEWLIGSISILIITLAFMHSYIVNKKAA